MRKVLDAIVDAGSLLPWGERYGNSVICALARIEGEAVGVVASQPMQRAGVMDVPALTKEAAFIDLCDTLQHPARLLPGRPGPDDRLGGRARRHPRPPTSGSSRGSPGPRCRRSRWWSARPTAAATSPSAAGPTHPDLVLAWPTAEMGFMAPATGVRTVHRRQLEETLEAEGQEAHDRLVDRARRGVGARVGALGGGGPRLPRRRHRPADDPRGGRDRASTSRGAAARASAKPGPRRSACPAAPSPTSASW